MKDHLAIWREKPWVWGIPFAFVVLTILSIVFFETAFSGQVAALKRSYDRQAELLESLHGERQRAESFIEQLHRQDDAVNRLYDDYFATEGERFTTVLREVRQRAREAGMDPLTFSYPEEAIDAYGLTRRGLNFGVNGTYEQLRRFINLLELTDQFITLEAVRLGDVQGVRAGVGDPRLEVRLVLSTLFVDTEFVDPGLTPTPEIAAPSAGTLPPEEGEEPASVAEPNGSPDGGVVGGKDPGSEET